MEKEQVLQVVQKALGSTRKVRITLDKNAEYIKIFRLMALCAGKEISLSHGAETVLRVFALHAVWERDSDRTMIVTFCKDFEEDRFIDVVGNSLENIEVCEVIKPNNPDFPTNRHNLVNGSVLVCTHTAVEAQLGIKMGSPIILGWTGKYVRFGQFTWSVEDICQEIDNKYWRVVEGSLDFSDPTHLELFNQHCALEPEDLSQ